MIVFILVSLSSQLRLKSLIALDVLRLLVINVGIGSHDGFGNGIDGAFINILIFIMVDSILLNINITSRYVAHVPLLFTHVFTAMIVTNVLLPLAKIAPSFS